MVRQEVASLIRRGLLCKLHHSLSEANLSFLFIPLLFGVVAISIVIRLAIAPGIVRLGVVIDNLLMKSVIRFAQGRIINGQKGEACRNEAWDGDGHGMMSCVIRISLLEKMKEEEMGREMGREMG